MLEPGPWMQHMVPYFWQIQGTAYASTLMLVIVQARKANQADQGAERRLAIQGRAA